MLFPLVYSENNKFILSFYDDNTQDYYEFNRPIQSWEAVEKICELKGSEKPIIVSTPDISKYTNIYFIRCGDHVKIGKADDVGSRFRSIDLMNGSDIELLFSYKALLSEEQRLHKKFKKYRVKGEWFIFHSSIEKYIKQKEKQNESKRDDISSFF